MPDMNPVEELKSLVAKMGKASGNDERRLVRRQVWNFMRDLRDYTDENCPHRPHPVRLTCTLCNTQHASSGVLAKHMLINHKEFFSIKSKYQTQHQSQSESGVKTVTCICGKVFDDVCLYKSIYDGKEFWRRIAGLSAHLKSVTLNGGLEQHFVVGAIKKL